MAHVFLLNSPRRWLLALRNVGIGSVLLAAVLLVLGFLNLTSAHAQAQPELRIGYQKSASLFVLQKAQGTLEKADYPALLDGPIPVTAMDSIIVVHESVPAEIVQKITATLIKNQGTRLAQIHPSMAGWTPARAVGYRGVPFHPGAIAAFRAAGVNPPAA